MPHELFLDAQKLPHTPGVYIFKNKKDEYLYIGKAKDLHKRVQSYFKKDQDARYLKPFLMRQACVLEYVITHTEKEALILENTLIKEHQPKYNIELKDDKNFLHLKLHPHTTYPKLEITRRIQNDGAYYFGPYHSAHKARETLKLVNRHFRLRSCRDAIFRNRQRACLQYEIKRCLGPCVFDIDKTIYQQNVLDVVRFLQNKNDTLIQQLNARMQAYANNEDFEQAARIRDQICAIKDSLDKQRVQLKEHIDYDVFAMAQSHTHTQICVLIIRQGQMVRNHTLLVQTHESTNSEILEAFLSQYYEPKTDIPNEILLQETLSDINTREQWLSEKSQHRVCITVPQKGEKKQLLDMAYKNAIQQLNASEQADAMALDALDGLQKSLRLSQFPERIECFDISHHQGQSTIGSQVVFILGQKSPKEYRSYQIQDLDEPDDFRSLYQVLTRRLKRGIEEGELPQLLLIDGGIGQLNAAMRAIADLNIEGVELCAIAKSRVLEKQQGYQGQQLNDTAHDSTEDTSIKRSPERIFLPHQKNPVIFSVHSKELRLLTALRDEAHRFAITKHRQKSKKRMIHSVLDNIPGIGKKRKVEILKHFSSLSQFEQASEQELINFKKIPLPVLKKAQEYLKSQH